MKIMGKTVTSAVTAGSLVGITWAGFRLFNAIAHLVTPAGAVQYTKDVTSAADASLKAALPLFLLDNGAVGVSNADGYVAVWDGYHARFAGLWAAGAEATLNVAVILVLLAVLLLGVRLLRGVPFTAGLTRSVGIAGAVLLVGSSLSQFFDWMSRQEMLATATGVLGPNGWIAPSSAIELDLVPLASGAVLLIIALAFSAGERLQQDTKGLV